MCHKRDDPEMKNGPILFLEESRPPRPLTWALVVLGGGTIAGADSGWNGPQPTMFSLYVIAGALLTILLLEFVAISVEVTTSHVQFFFAPFYRRRVAISDIQHWEVRTYPGNNFTGTYYHRTYFWKPPMHVVEVTMKDGSEVAFTSMHAEHLAHAISRAKGITSHPLKAAVPQ